MQEIYEGKRYINSKLDFTKICRVCKNERPNLLNLFAIDSDGEPSLGEKFLVCTSLHLREADNLPQNICYSCAKVLEVAHNFHKQCRRTDSELREYLASTKKNQTDIQSTPSSSYEIVFLSDESGANTELGNNNKSTRSASNKLLPINKFEIDEENLEDEKPTDEKPHKCEDCDKRFYTTAALQLHEKLHKKKRKIDKDCERVQQEYLYNCKKCNTIFENDEDYKTHKANEHPTKQLVCSICGKMFNSVTYKLHLLTHEQNKDYVCSVCSKQFSDQRYLSRHLLYHQTVSYKCVELDCGKDFNVKHKLVDHLRRYHDKNLTRADVKLIVGAVPDDSNDGDVETLE